MRTGGAIFCGSNASPASPKGSRRSISCKSMMTPRAPFDTMLRMASRSRSTRTAFKHGPPTRNRQMHVVSMYVQHVIRSFHCFDIENSTSTWNVWRVYYSSQPGSTNDATNFSDNRHREFFSVRVVPRQIIKMVATPWSNVMGIRVMCRSRMLSDVATGCDISRGHGQLFQFIHRGFCGAIG
jgi:hypothetical protein